MDDCASFVSRLIRSHPRFARVRKSLSRTGFFHNLLAVARECGQAGEFAMHREDLRINLCCSARRMEKELTLLAESLILEHEADGDTLYLRIAAWVLDERVDAPPLKAAPRHQFASDDPAYRKAQREAKKAQEEAQESGFVESFFTPQTTPQTEVAEPLRTPQSPFNLINLNQSIDLKEDSIQTIDSIKAGGSATAPQVIPADSDSVRYFTRSRFVQCGMEPETADKFIRDYGAERARDICAIINSNPDYQNSGFIVTAFKAGPSKYPPLKKEKIAKLPPDVQLRLGLLVPVAGKAPPGSANVVESISNPQTTPQKNRRAASARRERAGAVFRAAGFYSRAA